MNSKTGIVMEIKHRKACILTTDGEFTEVRINQTIPCIGSTYTGIADKKLSFHKYIAAVASFVLFTSMGGGAYAYYAPTTSVIVSINPSLELKLNRWNKIIKTTPLNKDGEQLASSINIKNKDIDTGLTLILDEAERENFINKNDTLEAQKISLDITSSKDVTLNLPKFEEKVNLKKLDIKIDYSKGNAKDDIIKNGNQIEKDTKTTPSNNGNINGTETDPSSNPSLPKTNNNKPDDPKSQDNSNKNINNSDKNKKDNSNSNKNDEKEKTKETIGNKKNSNVTAQPSKDDAEHSNNKDNDSKTNKDKDTKVYKAK